MSKTHKSIFLAVLMLSMAFNLQLLAWDVTGHRVIADIAYKNLTSKTRKNVDKILGNKGIIFESSWADGVRNEKGFEYSYPWHFQNLRDSMTFSDLSNLMKNPQTEGDHLFYAVSLMTQRLKTNPEDAEALKFLVHFIGDLHQPMHLGRKEDLGGNKIDVKWFGSQINLHSLWDSYLIDRQKLSYTEMSEMLMLKYQNDKQNISKMSLQEDVYKVYELRNKIYATDINTTSNYLYAHIFTDQLNEMLYIAGMQLAKILNGLY